ncbi:hypothetical protein A9X02_21880 [Mycobacterium malmoense]|nr:hypothetical protein A9X02_21880 [Mycobacterium malmoense]
MVANQPSWEPGVGPPAQPPAANWVPNHFGQPARRSRAWLTVALALTAAISALVVALAQPTAPSAPAISAAPSYSPTDVADAQQQLCDMYQLAAKAVQVDTAGTDKALARIATTNGALMLDRAASNPALDCKHRDAAGALKAAYLTVTAKSSYVVASETDFQSALDNVIGKDAVMKKVCGVG